MSEGTAPASNAGTGAAAPADGPSAAPSPAITAPSSAPPATPTQRMAESLKRMRARNAEGPPAPAPQQAPTAETSPADAAQPEATSTADARPDSDGESAQAEEGRQKKDTDSVPKKAFLERLAREGAKLRAEREKSAAKDLELAKATEAMRFLDAEVERLHGLLAKGATYDEKDEVIRGHELSRQAQEASSRLLSEHQAALKAQQEQEQIEQQSHAIEEEITGALQRYPMVSRRELIAEMYEKQGAPAEQVAAQLHKERLDFARKALAAEQPAPARAVPSTTRAAPSAPAAAVRYPDTPAGMAQRLRDARARSQ